MTALHSPAAETGAFKVAYRDLQSFIRDLDEKGQLKRIATEVDPLLEITAIADRVSKLPAAGNAPLPPVLPVT